MLVRPSLRRVLFLYWLPVLVVVAAVSIVSSLSAEVLDEATESVKWPITNGTWFHIGEFGVLSLLSYRLAHFYLRWPYQYLTLLVLLLAAGYGLLRLKPRGGPSGEEIVDRKVEATAEV